MQVLHRIMSPETGYLSVQQRARVALMVNSLGSVTPNELQIAAREAIRLLQETFQASLPLLLHFVVAVKRCTKLNRVYRHVMKGKQGLPAII